MAKEMIDIFDANENHIGVAEKYEAHKNGLWHRSFRCWVINPENKTLIFQLRRTRNTKNLDLDISVVGHLGAGEKIIDGKREIKEELGIDVQEKDLIFLGKSLDIFDLDFGHESSYLNREFVYMFFVKNSTRLENYIVQPDEVNGIFEIKISEALKLFSGEVQKIEAFGFLGNTREIIKKTIGWKDFHRHEKSYFLKICIMAERFLEGKKYLAV